MEHFRVDYVRGMGRLTVAGLRTGSNAGKVEAVDHIGMHGAFLACTPSSVLILLEMGGSPDDGILRDGSRGWRG
jgi:hypothetical protein